MPEAETIDAGLAPDAFDLAFEAAAGADLGDEPLVTDLPQDEPAEPVVEDPPKPEPAKEEPADPPPAEPPSAAPVVDPIKQAADDAAAKAAADKLKADEEKRKADEAAEAQRLAAEAAGREQFTADEQSLIASVTENFPEVGQAFDAIQRVMQARLENAIAAKTKELEAAFATQLAPLQNVVTQSVHDKHTQMILAAHPDAVTILPDVEKWVASVPKALQVGYNQILDKGSAEDVIEFLTFAKAQITPAAPVAPAAPVVDKEKERKLKSQEGVQGRSSTVQNAIDPDDFDGAFDKFAATKA